jgi:tetratricopeptide (TPR) repeat protein
MSRSSRWSIGLLIAVIAAGAGVLGWRAGWFRSAGVSPDMAKVAALNNRGVGLMETFEYAEASELFEQVVALAPSWQPGRINLAISLIHRQTAENLDRAISEFAKVLEADPTNPHAHFCTGYVLKYRKGLADAVPHFEAVVAFDPLDAGAWYHLGDCLYQLGEDRDRAVQCLEKAHALNPYLNSATYKLQLAIAATEPDRAERLLNEFKDLERTKLFQPTTDSYTDHGSRYAEVIGRPSTPLPGDAAPLPIFQIDKRLSVTLAPGAKWATSAELGQGPAADLLRSLRKRFGGTIVNFDYNGDGRPDLLLLAAVAEKGRVRELLLRNDGDGKFTDVTAAAGLAGERLSAACCIGDYDNDGHLDIFISSVGGGRLFRNSGKGSFDDVTVTAGIDQLQGVALGCTWVDLDQDGDLDLVVTRLAPDEIQALAALREGKATGGVALFLNVGVAPPFPADQPVPPLSTKFRRSEQPEAITRINGVAATWAVSDFDHDFDPDIMILADSKPPQIALNDRLLRAHLDTFANIPGENWNGALFLDIDHDERSDLVLLPVGKKPLIMLNRTSRGDKVKLEASATNAPPLRQAWAVDFDRDGWTDVVGLTESGAPVFLHNDRSGKLVDRTGLFGREWSGPADIVTMSVGDVTGSGFPDLILWSEAAGLELRRNLGNGNQVIRLALNGITNLKKSVRCNRDGLGTRVVVQAGPLWNGIENVTLSAGLGQSVRPIELGIGRATRADVLRLRWPDLVVQAELDVPAGELRRVVQVQRKPDSCPVIFTWDGTRFVYITDCLGAGSVGEIVADGDTRRPRPEESVKIEPNQLAPQDGFYVIKVAEPMDEIMYLDQLRLLVVDHPRDVTVYPDERFATAGSPPTQEVLPLREQYFPIAARDHHGRDVTATIRHRDRRMVDGFARRPWTGFAEEHWVEFDVGNQLANIRKSDRVFLVLAGWTEYAYPSSIFAATQAGVAPLAPTLEKEVNGTWQPVAELGFPAGLPRVMTVDVTGLLASHAGALRIRTNLQVFWDQIFLAPILPRDSVRITPLALAGASLADRGFAQEFSPDGKAPIEYDPERLEPVAATRWHGRRTKLGDVTELLRDADDRFVIGGPGDEVTARFDARSLRPLPSGWIRSFIVQTAGFCKDSASFTATAGAIEPLPFRAMKRYPPGKDEPYPHAGDRARWHTR